MTSTTTTNASLSMRRQWTHAAESAWDVGGAYLDIVERFVMIEAWSQVYAESDLAASVAKDLAGQEYSSIEETRSRRSARGRTG